MRTLSSISIIILFVACNNPANLPVPEKEANVEIEAGAAPGKQTITYLFNEAGNIDSLVILYYTDKIKFRYYQFYTTDSLSHLAIFKENLQTDTIPHNQCLKDGTIYGYIKGNIYTTLYFNLSDQCKFLRLFKNGRLYNYPLGISLQQELQRFKGLAKNP